MTKYTENESEKGYTTNFALLLSMLKKWLHKPVPRSIYVPLFNIFENDHSSCWLKMKLLTQKH